MRYRTDIRFGIEDFICKLTIFKLTWEHINAFFFILAAMGGLLGLGLGVSFISVIELLYFLCCRRIFLKRRCQGEDESVTNKTDNTTTGTNEVGEVWPSSISSISNPSLNGHSNVNVVRRNSFMTPKPLYKY